MLNVRQVIERTLPNVLGQTIYVESPEATDIDAIYNIALGDQVIDDRTGEIGVVLSIGECPYYGYENYPCAYVVAADRSWSEYLILDFYPDTTKEAYLAYDGLWSLYVPYIKQEPVWYPFEQALTEGRIAKGQVQ